MPKVLIVDDDRFQRSVIEKILVHDPLVRDFHVEVMSAVDGEEALRLFSEHTPDFVVVDTVLGKQSGLDLCAQLRALPNGDTTPLAVIGGVYQDDEVKNRVTELRGRLFTKPYQLRDLPQFLASVLAPAPATAASARETLRPGAAPARPAVGTTPVPPARTAAPLQPLNGDVAERSLPAVLLDLWEVQATGRLSLRRGRVAKEVDLVVGHPRSVASNVRDETLGHFLLARGIIDRAKHDAAMHRASTEGEKVGTALIAIGALTTQDLIKQLTAQARFKLMRALRWPDGSWSFLPRSQPAPGFHGEALQMESVVLRGLRRTASIEPLPPRVAVLRGRRLHLSRRGESLLPSIRRVFGSRMPDLWRDGMTPEDLEAAGMDRVGLFTVLEALVLCDGINADPATATGTVADSGDALSVGDLFDHSKGLREARPAPKAESFYSALFGDEITGTEHLPSSADEDSGRGHEDSGLIQVEQLENADLVAARRQVLDEYLRIQGATYYEVLGVDRRATSASIIAAAMEKLARFSAQSFQQFELGRDYAKLEEIHQAFERSRKILLDAKARAEHDRELQAREAATRAPTLEAELGFRAAEDLLAAGQFASAITNLEASIASAPNEAAYHAALGWARFAADGRTPSAADAALPHLNQALAINPDHPAAHEYKGIIIATLGKDDELAVMHLERALDSDPTRDAALACLEMLWRRRGEVRPIERQYRRLLYRLAGRDTDRELAIWLKLAGLYRNELDDLESTRIAYASAARLQPDNPAIQAALADIESGTLDRFHERAQELRVRFKRDPSSPEPISSLFEQAMAASRFDVAFIAASALVAMSGAPISAHEMYQRYRPRFVIRAQQRFDDELWDEVRHPEDSAPIGHLFALLEPVVGRAAPVHLADTEVSEGTRVDDSDLPAAFLRVRAYAAHMLGVSVPPVYARPDFGHQIHVAAVSPPVLLVGDEALAAPERSELSFRLGRAMSYLRAGRTLAGSHPARFLKQILLAAFSATHHGNSEDLERTVVDLRESIGGLSVDDLGEVGRLLEYLRSENRTINLSRWTRAMARTADRVGFVLSGDLPAAARFARESGEADALTDLIDFAISPSCSKLRTQMGLSVDV
jgi:CheY-like chemotaxis protein